LGLIVAEHRALPPGCGAITVDLGSQASGMDPHPFSLTNS
jgi:hypothetical protein